MITLDASLVIAHLSSSDAHHEVATAFLHASADDFVMHPLNLAEVLVGGARVGRGRELLDDLYAIGIRVADRSEDEPLQLATLRARSRLKLPDCCALHTAMTTGSALATFDETLADVARAHHVRVEPAR